MKTLSFIVVLLSVCFVSCTQNKMSDLYSIEVAYRYTKDINNIDTVKYKREFLDAYMDLTETEKAAYTLFRDSVKAASAAELAALRRDEQKAISILHD